MVTFIVWLIMAAACAGVANGKGRRAWLWAILGILGGLISLIVIICLPKIEDLKQCTKCANKVKQEALICHYCGYDFINKKMPNEKTEN